MGDVTLHVAHAACAVACAVLPSVFGSDEIIQAVFAAGVVAVSAFAQLGVQPFSSPLLNKLEASGLIVVFFIQLGSILYWRADSGASADAWTAAMAAMVVAYLLACMVVALQLVRRRRALTKRVARKLKLKRPTVPHGRLSALIHRVRTRSRGNSTSSSGSQGEHRRTGSTDNDVQSKPALELAPVPRKPLGDGRGGVGGGSGNDVRQSPLGALVLREGGAFDDAMDTTDPTPTAVVHNPLLESAGGSGTTSTRVAHRPQAAARIPPRVSSVQQAMRVGRAALRTTRGGKASSTGRARAPRRHVSQWK